MRSFITIITIIASVALVGFADYPGLYLYHCHNLEHEDMGMMRNYYIRA